MELLQNNFVINLESRTDRMAHVEAEFSKINLKCNRFNAIKMKNGAVGCTLSHIRCLEFAIQNDYDQVFICEDDITFLNHNQMMKSLKKFNNKINTWDVLLIGGNVIQPYTQIEDFCLKVTNIQTTTGYVVNKHYYRILMDNFKTGLEQLLRTNEKKLYAIDMYWKHLQSKGEWYFLYPLTVTQYENYSDIEERETNYNHLMLDPEKKWLYKTDE